SDLLFFFFKQKTAYEIFHVTGVQTCALPIFFIVVYMHMFRALLYGSFRRPRELTWIFGVLIFLCLMAEAFFGYLLPWGQMSFWEIGRASCREGGEIQGFAEGV